MLLADASQIRLADQRMIEGLGFPGYILMETAGRRAAEEILSYFSECRKCLVLAGPGNNGGDGLVIARHLRLAGWQVEILFSDDPSRNKGDALIALNALNGSSIPQHVWPDCPELEADTLLVDALLGTGLKGGPKGNVAEIIQRFSSSPNPVVAIDLPSGLDADTGECVASPLKAALTVTFQLPKVCHHVYPAAAQCGEVIVLDIGIWPEVIGSLGIRRHVVDGGMVAVKLQKRNAEGHKGSYGHVLCVGGSERYAGAIALAAHAALRVGAGLSTAFCPEICREAVHALGPEVMLDPKPGLQLGGISAQDIMVALKGKSAVGAGPGLGQGEGQTLFLEQLLKASKLPTVLDADALNILAAHPRLWEFVQPNTILTPHPGEMVRLQPNPDPLKQRLESAEKLARERNVIVVLKGAGTIIASPDGTTFVNTTGNPGMGTGGTGDVLTGMIAGLLGQLDPLTAAWMAVYLHGLAGDLTAKQLGERSLTASDILHFIPSALIFTQEQPLYP